MKPKIIFPVPAEETEIKDSDHKVWPLPDVNKNILSGVESTGPVLELPIVSKMKLFVVDTITTIRHRYVVEALELEHAYDEVTMIDSGDEEDYFPEVTQRDLGSTIIDGRKISKKQYNKMLKSLSVDKYENSSHWMGDKLIRRIDYDK